MGSDMRGGDMWEGKALLLTINHHPPGQAIFQKKESGCEKEI